MGEVSVGQSLSMIAFLVFHYYSNCSIAIVHFLFLSTLSFYYYIIL